MSYPNYVLAAPVMPRDLCAETAFLTVLPLCFLINNSSGYRFRLTDKTNLSLQIRAEKSALFQIVLYYLTVPPKYDLHSVTFFSSFLFTQLIIS